MDELPRNHFGVIAADPPWRFLVRSPKGEGRSASRHYRTMPFRELVTLPVSSVAAPDAWLFLWAVGPMLRHALDLIKAWGFTYSGIGFCWVKTNPRAPQLLLDRNSFHVGLGYTTRKNVELCLVARRGHPKRLRRDIRELIIAPRREHSRKPEEFYERIQQFAAGPYLDLFARSERPGFTAWGDETRKFGSAGDATTDVVQAGL